MIELNEVVYHWQKGQNISQISRSLGISRPTVRKYLDAAIGITRCTFLTHHTGKLKATECRFP
jgi:DNA-binding transcriptional regulator LsrR (DeoR family)